MVMVMVMYRKTPALRNARRLRRPYADGGWWPTGQELVVPRLVATLAADVQWALKAIRSARATARQRAWDWPGTPRPALITVDIDATIRDRQLREGPERGCGPSLRSLPPKRPSTPRSARRLSTTNRELLSGVPALTRTGLPTTGLDQS
jgi:hypothetical protein